MVPPLIEGIILFVCVVECVYVTLVCVCKSAVYNVFVLCLSMCICCTSCVNHGDTPGVFFTVNWGDTELLVSVLCQNTVRMIMKSPFCGMVTRGIWGECVLRDF